MTSGSKGYRNLWKGLCPQRPRECGASDTMASERLPWGHGNPEKPLAQEKEDRGSGTSLAFKPWYLPSPRPMGSSQKPIPREQQLRIKLKAEARAHDPADSARLKPQLHTGQAGKLSEPVRAAFSQGPPGFL